MNTKLVVNKHPGKPFTLIMIQKGKVVECITKNKVKTLSELISSPDFQYFMDTYHLENNNLEFDFQREPSPKSHMLCD